MQFYLPLKLVEKLNYGNRAIHTTHTTTEFASLLRKYDKSSQKRKLSAVEGPFPFYFFYETFSKHEPHKIKKKSTRLLFIHSYFSW